MTSSLATWSGGYWSAALSLLFLVFVNGQVPPDLTPLFPPCSKSSLEYRQLSPEDPIEPCTIYHYEPTPNTVDVVIDVVHVTPNFCANHRDGAAHAARTLNAFPPTIGYHNNVKLGFRLVSVIAGNQGQSDYATMHEAVLRQLLEQEPGQGKPQYIVGTCPAGVAVERELSLEYETMLLAVVGPPSYYDPSYNPWIYGLPLSSDDYPLDAVRRLSIHANQVEQDKAAFYKKQPIKVIYRTSSEFFYSTCLSAITQLRKLGFENIQEFLYDPSADDDGDGVVNYLDEDFLQDIANQACPASSNESPALFMCSLTEQMVILPTLRANGCRPFSVWMTPTTWSWGFDNSDQLLYFQGAGQWDDAMDYGDAYFSSGTAMLDTLREQTGYQGDYDAIMTYCATMLIHLHLRDAYIVEDEPNPVQDFLTDPVRLQRQLRLLKTDDSIFGPISFNEYQRNNGRASAAMQWLPGDDGKEQLTLVSPFLQAEASTVIPAPTANDCEAGLFLDEALLQSAPALLTSKCEHCPVDTFTETTNTLNECTPCPTNWHTNSTAGAIACMDLEADPKDFPLEVPALIGLSVAFVVILIGAYFVIREFKRKAADMLWQIKRSELVFQEPVEVLGRGTFGLVFLAEYRGTQVAVKRVIPHRKGASETAQESTMLEGGDLHSRYVSYNGHTTNKKAKTIRKMKDDFMAEMRIVSRLRHPCITTVMGAVIESAGQEPMMVLEYMELGALYDVIHNDTIRMDGETIVSILGDVAQGMHFLHSASPQIVHGDLKAQNVLIDRYFRAKVSDFGLSQKSTLGGTGTPLWMAPELLRKETANTTASDVYSYGITLFEVCARKNPYEGEETLTVLSQVRDKSIRKRVTAPPSMPEQLRVLMMDCLDEDASRRPNFEEIRIRLQRIDTEKLAPPAYTVPRTMNEKFPTVVASAIRQGRKVLPEKRDSATIVAIEIVGLDDLETLVGREKLSSLVKVLDRQLRDLAIQEGLFLLDTQGNTFMAVSNLISDQSSDHASRAFQFASHAIRAAKITLVDPSDPARGFVPVRVGVHAGRVVADVVGNRDPRYSLLGDTAYIASSMAHDSPVYAINCSVDAQHVLSLQCGNVVLIPRNDSIKIRGKGAFPCFLAQSNDTKIQDAVERARAKGRLRFLRRSADEVCGAGLSDDDNNDQGEGGALHQDP